MAAIAFDTLAYSKKLRAAGIPVEQADAFTRALQDAIRPVDAKQKVELIKWVIGLLIAQSGLFMGLMYFLHQKP